MASNCGSASTLDYNLDFPCDNIPSEGVRETILWCYLSDLASLPVRKAATGAGSKVITAIALKAGKKLRSIQGYKTSNNYTQGFATSNFGKKIPHGFQFLIFDQSEEGRYAVDLLTDAEGIVVFSRDKDLAGNWNVHGINTGMTCTNLTQDKNNENGGAFVLDFSAPNERKTVDILRVMDGAADGTDTYLATITTADA